MTSSSYHNWVRTLQDRQAAGLGRNGVDQAGRMSLEFYSTPKEINYIGSRQEHKSFQLRTHLREPIPRHLRFPAVASHGQYRHPCEPYQVGSTTVWLFDPQSEPCRSMTAAHEAESPRLDGQLSGDFDRKHGYTGKIGCFNRNQTRPPHATFYIIFRYLRRRSIVIDE